MAASPMSEPPYAVEALGLEKTYPGGPAALRGIDFYLRSGERVALLGPNGAGKTTLVKTIAGLLTPDAGELKLFGARPAPALRRRLGFLFEEAENLYGYLTGWENLLFYGRLAGVREHTLRRRALELLDEFDLEAAKGRPAQSLSRGQKQRLALASVLIQGARSTSSMSRPWGSICPPSATSSRVFRSFPPLWLRRMTRCSPGRSPTASW